MSGQNLCLKYFFGEPSETDMTVIAYLLIYSKLELVSISKEILSTAFAECKNEKCRYQYAGLV